METYVALHSVTSKKIKAIHLLSECYFKKLVSVYQAIVVSSYERNTITRETSANNQDLTNLDALRKRLCRRFKRSKNNNDH